ncbi:SDR family oxidoreductase [Xenorhabdus miraniensis]|uniref:Linear gramicidin synthetase subunit B n=1 Tax=Xenorhabdus miraniensis TaxID=351674 RepID=A0A2D0JU69_9GAMM|nr:SDR family oxidoreductase [Xenorhabdus miraniensis]PHM49885.1 linear gramicidin synthetase subunit B [Xenorhabdus miraniensis]
MLNSGNKDIRNILLTGATGVLGGRILLEMLTTTGANIYCLMREADEQQALSRIKNILFVYDQEKKSHLFTHRIIPVLGDVSKKRLGLTKEIYHELIEKTDRVVHCAANVKLLASYGTLAPVNVQGTHNIIEFCLQGDIPLLYTSSFSMIGDRLFQDGFVLHETDLDVGQRFRDMDYERTKFESEKAVHSAGKQGLKWVIVRPGNIWGDSCNGGYPLYQTKVKGLYYEIIKSLVETGFTINSDEDFDISPVDYVAKASLYAIFNIQLFDHKTLNLTNPNPTTYNQIVSYLRAFGYRIQHIDNTEYLKALSQNRIYRHGKPYRSVFTDILGAFYREGVVSERAKYATQLTTDLLNGSGIKCTESNYELFSLYFNYLIEFEFIPAPQQQGEQAEIREGSFATE